MYSKAPKDPRANLAYRRAILEWAAKSPINQAAVIWRASQDLIWFVDTFCWTYDPRLTDCTVVPFITYAFQEETLLRINQSIEQGDDIVIEKSRDMGASWMCLLVFFWRWLFKRMQSFLLLSRVEDLVDKKNESDSLFWKVDFLLKFLPAWLKPAYERQKLSLQNLDYGSSITGSSTTSESGRGGRKTAALLDEFAAVPEGHAMLRATRDMTNCRIFNSTPQGTGNAFYDIRTKLLPLDQVLTLHWTLHPEKAEGLYFVDGKPRSPWYDKQCARAANLVEIAQELDIDYINSAWQYFDSATIHSLIEKHARAPFHVFTPDDLRARLNLRGELAAKLRDPLYLWIYPDAYGVLPKDRDYAAGCDISTGKDGDMSSQSVASFGDRLTKTKIGMFCARNLFPSEFAEVVTAMCRLIFGGSSGDAFLGWESNGPGGEFGKQVVDLGYRNIYYKGIENIVGVQKLPNPGWSSNRETKRLLLSQYAVAVTTEEFINRSREALLETLEYVHDPNGDIKHAKSRNDVDPTSAGENHGDMVIADAILNLLMKERPSRQEAKPPEITPYSYAGRMMMRMRERRKAQEERLFASDYHEPA